VKRHGKLYGTITDFGNLYLGARQAQKAKRNRDTVLAFNYNLERNLIALQDELRSRTYRPGGFQTFVIHDPKRRLISAAPYRDRVVHHAVCQIVAPIFDRTYIQESYANRTGKGTHRALKHFAQCCRSHKYVFQADIQKYFPSIDHEILKAEIRRKIKCPDTLWLLDTIIDHSNEQEPTDLHFSGDDLFAQLRRRGIPIGNLTSQHFANVYLNRFDHFIKEQLLCSGYVRYVDDFCLFSNERGKLVDWRNRIEERLAELRVRIHPIKSQISETRRGIDFVGFRVLPGQTRVLRKGLRRAYRRFHELQQAFATGEVDLDCVKQCLTSWIAQVSHADSMGLQKEVLSSLVFQRQS